MFIFSLPENKLEMMWPFKYSRILQAGYVTSSLYFHAEIATHTSVKVKKLFTIFISLKSTLAFRFINARSDLNCMLIVKTQMIKCIFS